MLIPSNCDSYITTSCSPYLPLKSPFDSIFPALLLDLIPMCSLFHGSITYVCSTVLNHIYFSVKSKACRWLHPHVSWFNPHLWSIQPLSSYSWWNQLKSTKFNWLQSWFWLGQLVNSSGFGWFPTSTAWRLRPFSRWLGMGRRTKRRLETS